MTERKMDLERRLNALQGEREGLSTNLDESHDRIVMLEKQTREQEHIVSLANKGGAVVEWSRKDREKKNQRKPKRSQVCPLAWANLKKGKLTKGAQYLSGQRHC